MTLRAYRSEDAAGILSIYGPVVATSSATFEYEVPSLEVFEKRLAAIAGRFPFLVAEATDGSIAGYAYGTTHRERIAYQWAVESSVYVREPGQGLGRKLYDALLPQLAERGFLWAYGVITQPNPASISLHAACGYESFATYAAAGQKFGHWHDVHWMRKALNEPLPQQPAPKFAPAQDPRS